jgi:hypothetical protein
MAEVGPLSPIEQGARTVTDVSRDEPPRLAVAVLGPAKDQAVANAAPAPVGGEPAGEVVHVAVFAAGHPVAPLIWKVKVWPMLRLEALELT